MSPRNRSTEAATAANILRKQQRWAEELRSSGWHVEEVGEILLLLWEEVPEEPPQWREEEEIPPKLEEEEEEEVEEKSPPRKPSPRPREEARDATL